MSANFEAKKAVVEEIKEKINASKSVVLVHYERLTVAEVTDLRNKFRAANSEYKVYKNTLVRKAFDELGVNDFDNDLNGATAFVFCPDETSGCSILAKSREVLIAKMLGCLQAPIANLAYVLGAIAKNKE